MKDYRLNFVATPDTIDELGHVNNAVWVQWIQKVATSHWDAAAPADHKAAYIWVVVRHEIDYLRALGPDACVTGRTWVADEPVGAKFDRYTEFTDDNGRVYLRATTRWALLDKATGRPLRVTPDIIAAFVEGDGGWRTMRAEDLADVVQVAGNVHVNYPEPAVVFANRLSLYPQGCWVYQQAGRVVGYMIAHPWPSDLAAPKLGMTLERLPSSRSLYLHDMALLADARGSGAGASGTDLLCNVAQASGFGHIWLTAVDGADSYWASKGFQRVGDDEPYGAGSMAMERVL